MELIDEKPVKNIIAYYEGFDKGRGNTSIAFDDANTFKWSGESSYEHETWGYFDSTGKEIPYIKSDRDLGQTFTVFGDSPKKLKSVTVRTGFGSNVVHPGMYGKAISIQILRLQETKF
ncbi:MAG: hypothetical protein HC830_09405 [Bacteroidetes bacterium]|nr:hypothetical protein [Bacteroidota bacterium]